MRTAYIVLVVAFAGCTPPPPFQESVPTPPSAHGTTGVLIMAHGGEAIWNQQVAAAAAPIALDFPTAVAYGMADPGTLSAALDSLRDQGVDRVAVVRLFLSGESFRDQTEFYLGLDDTPPETFVLMGPAASAPGAREPIQHSLAVATHPHGLLDAHEARTISVERALAASTTPATESVLLLAHGMGDEAENDRVLAAMSAAADSIRTRGFATVSVATLREDWEDARVVAEAAIRDFVTDESHAGRNVIVLPMRLSGFGPYAEVLEGLSYSPGEGLLPHDAVGAWVRRTAVDVACSAGWGPALGPCPVPISTPLPAAR